MLIFVQFFFLGLVTSFALGASVYGLSPFQELKISSQEQGQGYLPYSFWLSWKEACVKLQSSFSNYSLTRWYHFDHLPKIAQMAHYHCSHNLFLNQIFHR